jgi:hypothetical protein
MRSFALSLIALLPLLGGCSSEPYQVAPVSGRVTLNGKPLAKASVTFAPVPTKGSDEPGPSSAAITDSDGRFTLKTIGKDKAGAVVGKHLVRIALLGDTPAPADDRPIQERGQLPMKYNAKTELEFDVPAGGTDAADFPLKVP